MVLSSWVAGGPWSVNGGAYGWRELHHVTKWVRLVLGTDKDETGPRDEALL